MSKKTFRENFRVEVEPGTWSLNEAVIEDDCNRIAREVRRHIDDHGAVRVLWDTKSVCSHCGSGWEDLPGCCDKAMDEYEAEHPSGKFDENGEWCLKAVSDD